MAAIIYRYTAQTNVGWTNPVNAVDGVDDTYAYRSQTGESETYNIKGVTNNAPASGDPITKVEIGIEGYVNATDLDWRIRPVFNGVNGSLYSVTNMGTSDTDAIFWKDVTNSVNAPSPWTWGDVQTMDGKVWLDNNAATPQGGSQPSRTGYLDQIWIRVTTQPPTVGYAYSNGLASVSTIAMLMRKAILAVCGITICRCGRGAG